MGIEGRWNRKKGWVDLLSVDDWFVPDGVAPECNGSFAFRFQCNRCLTNRKSQESVSFFNGGINKRRNGLTKVMPWTFGFPGVK